MRCRESCGACCIAPSIRHAYYGMPRGKPAGVPCVHLDPQMRCRLFGDPRRPELCSAFLPEAAICGDDATQALRLLGELEQASLPCGDAQP